MYASFRRHERVVYAKSKIMYMDRKVIVGLILLFVGRIYGGSDRASHTDLPIATSLLIKFSLLYVYLPPAPLCA